MVFKNKAKLAQKEKERKEMMEEDIKIIMKSQKQKKKIGKTDILFAKLATTSPIPECL